MRLLDLFAGIGGFSLAAHWAGWETIGFVEWDEFNQKVLAKNFPNVPIHGDINTYKGVRNSADIICGGFPCQPFSTAGKRKGAKDDRHLWPEMLRVIQEVRPTWVIGENVAGIRSMGRGPSLLEAIQYKVESIAHMVGPYSRYVTRKREVGILNEICEDLEKEGYEVQPFLIPACSVGAPHRRDRIWIVAHAKSERCRKEGQNIQKSKERIACTNTSLCSNTNDILYKGRVVKGRCMSEAIGSKTSHKLKEKQAQNRKRVRLESCECNSIYINTYNDKEERFGRNGGEILPVQESTGHGRRPSNGSYSSGKRLEGHTWGELGSIPKKDSDAKEWSSLTGIHRETEPWANEWPTIATSLCRVGNGIPPWMDRDRAKRLKSLGNAIVPQVAYRFFDAINQVNEVA